MKTLTSRTPCNARNNFEDIMLQRKFLHIPMNKQRYSVNCTIYRFSELGKMQVLSIFPGLNLLISGSGILNIAEFSMPCAAQTRFLSVMSQAGECAENHFSPRLNRNAAHKRSWCKHFTVESDKLFFLPRSILTASKQKNARFPSDCTICHSAKKYSESKVVRLDYRWTWLLKYISNSDKSSFNGILPRNTFFTGETYIDSVLVFFQLLFGRKIKSKL